MDSTNMTTGQTAHVSVVPYQDPTCSPPRVHRNRIGVVMFVTSPSFEQLVPKAIGGSDGRYWTAVMLASDTPWFLLTFCQELEGLSWLQTVAMSWETTLLSFFESAPAAAVRFISCLGPDPAREGCWLMREIAELWRPCQSEADETGPLLFRFAGEGGLRDSFDGAMLAPLAGRDLLFRVSPAGGHGSMGPPTQDDL